MTCVSTFVPIGGVLDCTTVQENSDCTTVEIKVTFEDNTTLSANHYNHYTVSFSDIFSNTLTGLTGPANTGGQYLLLNVEAKSNFYLMGFELYVLRTGFIKFEVCYSGLLTSFQYNFLFYNLLSFLVEKF